MLATILSVPPQRWQVSISSTAEFHAWKNNGDKQSPTNPPSG
jgi:hypothetical protein